MVLNKIDLLADAEIETYIKFLKNFVPTLRYLPSPQNRTNIGPLADYIMANDARLKTVDISAADPILSRRAEAG